LPEKGKDKNRKRKSMRRTSHLSRKGSTKFAGGETKLERNVKVKHPNYYIDYNEEKSERKRTDQG